MIPILADENIPLLAVRYLRAAGVDILSVAESDPRASDQNVLELAESKIGSWLLSTATSAS